MKHVVVGTPALDGSVCIQYLGAIIETKTLLEASGYRMSMRFVVQDSLVMRARNTIVEYFIESGADDLIMIDSDIGWTASDFLRLLSYDVPIVAGVYQRKSDSKLDFTVKFPDDGVVRDRASGLFKAERVGTGFLRLRRDAIELMMDKYKSLQYKSADGLAVYCLFDTSMSNGEFIGEDYTFCDRWRAIGGEIWIDADIRLAHIGSKVFDKSIRDVLIPV